MNTKKRVVFSGPEQNWPISNRFMRRVAGHKSVFFSLRFWLCNVLSWMAFNLAEGVRNSFDGSDFLDNCLQYLPTALFGMVGGMLVRYLHIKYTWYSAHPVALIPRACFIAIVFGVVCITLNYFDLVVSISEVCSRDFIRPPFSCGKLSDLFLQSMGAMAIWCLFYFLIEAERKTDGRKRFSWLDLLKAVFCLISLSYLGTYLSVIAYVEWGDTHYLYTRGYLINVLSLLTPIFSTVYVLFIRSELKIWGAKTIPLIPMLFVLSLCCVTLNMGAGGVLSRLDHLPDNWTFRFVFFGEVYGNFSHVNVLAGVIDGSFVSTLLMTLFYMTCRFKDFGEKASDSYLLRGSFNKVYATWMIYILFWLFFALLFYGTDLMGWSEFGKSVPFINVVSFTTAGAFIGAVLRLQMLQFATKHASLIMLTLRIVVASMFAGVLLSSTIWFVSYTTIFVLLKGENIELYSSFVAVDNFVFASILSSCVLCGLWSFICFMVESMRLHRESTVKQLQLEKSMKDIQLNALAGKLDPHFIFNALNNIRALVNEDREKARSAIAVLSDILRSPMTNNLKDKTSLSEELDLVRNYVSLSKIQLEERLVYQEDIEDSARSALIPSMMLQILVENAIKHGISQIPEGGTLFITAKQRDQELVCEVTNHGDLCNTEKTSGFGIGVNTVRERLRLLYSGAARFSLQESAGTVVAKLVLPFERSL